MQKDQTALDWTYSIHAFCFLTELKEKVPLRSHCAGEAFEHRVCIFCYWKVARLEWNLPCTWSCLAEDSSTQRKAIRRGIIPSISSIIIPVSLKDCTLSTSTQFYKSVRGAQECRPPSWFSRLISDVPAHLYGAQQFQSVVTVTVVGICWNYDELRQAYLPGRGLWLQSEIWRFDSHLSVSRHAACGTVNPIWLAMSLSVLPSDKYWCCTGSTLLDFMSVVAAKKAFKHNPRCCSQPERCSSKTAILCDVKQWQHFLCF